MNDSITSINPSELSERLRLAWEDWAIKNGEALASKKEMERTHAQEMILCGEIPTGKATMQATASEGYAEAVKNWVKAETEANKARGLRESLNCYVELIRTFEASKRAEQRLGR